MLWIVAGLGASAAGSRASLAVSARREPRPGKLGRGGGPERRGRVATESSTDIIQRVRAGDADAFAELFRAPGDDVLRVCRRMLGGPEAAEDARSEVFLKARRAIDGYDPAQPFRGWLLAITSHHCIDQLRRVALERRIFADGDLEPGDLAGPAPSPLSRLLARERQDALDRAIETLPLELRLPLLLRYFSDASYDDIAASLGTTRSRVGTLIFRAKRRLRAQLTRSGASPHDATGGPVVGEGETGT